MSRKCFPALSRLSESGACLDSRPTNQRLASFAADGSERCVKNADTEPVPSACRRCAALRLVVPDRGGAARSRCLPGALPYWPYAACLPNSTWPAAAATPSTSPSPSPSPSPPAYTAVSTAVPAGGSVPADSAFAAVYCDVVVALLHPSPPPLTGCAPHHPHRSAGVPLALSLADEAAAAGLVALVVTGRALSEVHRALTSRCSLASRCTVSGSPASYPAGASSSRLNHPSIAVIPRCPGRISSAR